MFVLLYNQSSALVEIRESFAEIIQNMKGGIVEVKKQLIKGLILSFLAVLMAFSIFYINREGGNYIGKNYFDSDDFRMKCCNFESSIVPLILAVPEKKVKKKITVTAEEIDEYRYQFGSSTRST